MKIKIVLSSGKEIELTKEEFEELKLNFKETVYYSNPPNPWYKLPEITCGGF